MSLTLNIGSKFFEEGKLASKVEIPSRTALERGACFILKGALHLSISTTINLIVVIHFL